MEKNTMKGTIDCTSCALGIYCYEHQDAPGCTAYDAATPMVSDKTSARDVGTSRSCVEEQRYANPTRQTPIQKQEDHRPANRDTGVCEVESTLRLPTIQVNGRSVEDEADKEISTSLPRGAMKKEQDWVRQLEGVMRG